MASILQLDPAHYTPYPSGDSLEPDVLTTPTKPIAPEALNFKPGSRFHYNTAMGFTICLQEMAELMYAAPGVGIAGPQVGLPWRICLINDGSIPLGMSSQIPKEGWIQGPGEQRAAIVVNPRIILYGSKESDGVEGCLSIPGKHYMVPRSSHVRVHFLDVTGRVHIGGLFDGHARVWQHEIDHLDGFLACHMGTEQKKSPS